MKGLLLPGQGDSQPETRVLFRLLHSNFQSDFVDLRSYPDEIDVSILVSRAIEDTIIKIDSFKPDVLVGHSVGAAVIAFMISRGLYQGSAILLGVAHHQLFLQQKLALDENWLLEPFAMLEDLNRFEDSIASPKKVLIIHGLNDATISLSEVNMLAEVWKGKGGHVEVRAYEDDHDCTMLLKDDAYVKEWMAAVCDTTSHN